MTKMGYSFDDVNTALKLLGLVYDLKEKRKLQKKGRGRPKKDKKRKVIMKKKRKLK